VEEGKRLLAFRQELNARVRVRRNHCRSRFPGARSRSGIVDRHSLCQPPVLAVGHALDDDRKLPGTPDMALCRGERRLPNAKGTLNGDGSQTVRRSTIRVEPL
jgi:hypothetical protein